MGEDPLDNRIMETTDMVKSTIRGCAPFGYQDMDMGMEVDAVAESLDHSHHSRHKLKTCGCVQEFHKCSHRREAEQFLTDYCVKTAEDAVAAYWKLGDDLWGSFTRYF